MTGFCPKLFFRQPGFLELSAVVFFRKAFVGYLPLDGLIYFSLCHLDLLALGTLEQDFFGNKRIERLELGSRQLNRAKVTQLGIGLLLFQRLFNAPIDFRKRNDNGIDPSGNFSRAPGCTVSLTATGKKSGAPANQC
jgi:hypothetical protein